MKIFLPFAALLAMIALLAFGVTHETQRATAIAHEAEVCQHMADNLVKANQEWITTANELLNLHDARVNKTLAPHIDKVQSILRGSQ